MEEIKYFFQYATPKHTSKPVRYELVSSHCLTRSIRDLEERICSINHAALSIQSFAMVLLFVSADNLTEAIPLLSGSLLGFSKLCAELLHSFFEMCDLPI